MPLDGTLYEPDDTILRGLHDAQEQIRDPEHWCQGHMAENVSMVGCSLLDSDAVRWCALGALDLYQRGENTFKYLKDSATEMGYPMISMLNNTTDHPTVMKMFDRAQELRRAEIMETAHA